MDLIVVAEGRECLGDRIKVSVEQSVADSGAFYV